MSYNMQDGNTAYDIASFEGHTHICQELLTKYFSWTLYSIYTLILYTLCLYVLYLIILWLFFAFIAIMYRSSCGKIYTSMTLKYIYNFKLLLCNHVHRDTIATTLNNEYPEVYKELKLKKKKKRTP